MLKENNTSLDPNGIDFNLSTTRHNKSPFNKPHKVNASLINGNELFENRNINTKRTLQKSLTSKSLPNDPLKNVVILGDSIVKHVNGWKISRKLKNCRVKVMPFSGATVQCSADYVKPLLRDKTSHLTLHIGTND